jgi:hypothetical protein
MDAGRWLAEDRGALVVEEAYRPEVRMPPARYPLMDRVAPDQLAALFVFRAHLPIKNGLTTEAGSPRTNGLMLV